MLPVVAPSRPTRPDTAGCPQRRLAAWAITCTIPVVQTMASAIITAPRMWGRSDGLADGVAQGGRRGVSRLDVERQIPSAASIAVAGWTAKG